MPYEFFFSYARADRKDTYLLQFYGDLCNKVRDLMGLKPEVKVGFFDEQLKLGEEWDLKVTQALRESKVMVCLYSPVYFNSEECGKEWQFFHERRLKYVEERKTPGGDRPALPPLIKGVVWIAPLPKQLDPKVRAAQYKKGSPAAVENSKGLKYILEKSGKRNARYVDFVRDLATEIKEAAEDQTLVLPDLAEPKSYRKVESAFSQPQQAGGQQAQAGTATYEPKRIRFVVVAADPKQFGGVRSADAYLDNGGGEWRPFWPNDKTSILPFVQNVVSDRELGFISDEAEFSANLQKVVEDAFNDRKIVIILVDSWTVHWKAQYRAILEKFDQNNYVNCSVLVPQNDDDEDANKESAQIEQTLKDTFKFRMDLRRDSDFFRYSIRSPDDLRDALREIVVRLKDRMRNEVPVAQERKIETEITFQNVSGPNV